MITFKKSNIVVKKYNKNDTLLDIAEENGVLIDFGCRSLMCSSCIVKTDGNIEVEPSDLLTEEEIKNGYVLACAARAKGDLTVDA